MTHHDGQRWIAIPSEEVTAAVLERRDDPEFIARFRSHVDTRSVDGDECDIWTGALSSEGYGNFKVGKHVVRAHRVAWIIAFGAPHPELFLDHVWPICRYRFCVNEFHLEPVTNQTNTKRGVGIGRAGQRAARYAAIAARDEWEAVKNGRKQAA